jgi:hypothetical protein
MNAFLRRLNPVHRFFLPVRRKNAIQQCNQRAYLHQNATLGAVEYVYIHEKEAGKYSGMCFFG